MASVWYRLVFPNHWIRKAKLDFSALEGEGDKTLLEEEDDDEPRIGCVGFNANCAPF